MKQTPPIALLGGTFDPIHNGHLAIAHAVYQQLKPQEIRFIPCYQPAHRIAPIASPEDRLAMVKLAIKDENDFVVDDREIQRQGPSYMIDTLQSLQKEFPGKPLCLILSTDAFANFQHWHRWQEILNYCHLIVTQRPGYILPNNTELLNFLAQHKTTDIKKLAEKLAGYIFLLNFTGPDISATAIRKKISEKIMSENLLPTAVWEYIKKEKLYLT